ncbi:hypothetical protein V2J09_002441 [Rumex salicifolius]
MVEEKDNNGSPNTYKVENWLSRAEDLIPVALGLAKRAKGFSTRWKMITLKLEQIPPRLSNLSTHPCFSKNALCKEQLRSVVKNLNEVIQFAELCNQDKFEGKLQMQSELDSLCGKLDLSLNDCSVLIKTGVLTEFTTTREPSSSEPDNIKELLARLQIGDMESKTKALNSLIEIMDGNEKAVLSCIGRSNVSSLVNLLSTASPRTRDKAATVISSLVESGAHENWLISETVLPSIIRLIEYSGSPIAREKGAIILQRLSSSVEAARSMVLYGAVMPLLESCTIDDSVLQSIASKTLKNLSGFPELQENLAEEGVVPVMIDLLESGLLSGSKEYAAECLKNLTSSNKSFQRSVIEEGGIRVILAYLDSPLPQESAVLVLRNLVSLMPFSVLDSLGFLPRLAHVLTSGSSRAKQAAASTICRVSTSLGTKKMVVEGGCIPLLVKTLEANSNGAREAAAQALSSLMALPRSQKEVKEDERSIPNLVRLLDPNPSNTAKKYAVSCLEAVCSSNKCKKLMISYGAIGYLKKLTQMEVIGAKKLLDRLEMVKNEKGTTKHGLITQADISLRAKICQTNILGVGNSHSLLSSSPLSEFSR